jgi:phenylalanyl-tRNA synthetase alpha chain
MMRLPEIEYRVLAALEPSRPLLLSELAGSSGVDQSLLMAGALTLSQRALVAISEQSQDELSLTAEGCAAAAAGLPERLALLAIQSAGGTVPFTGLAQLLGRDDTRAEVKWLTKRGWCRRDATTLTVSDKGRVALDSKGADELLIERLGNGPMTETELASAGLDLREALELLKGRGELLKRRRRVSRSFTLTEAGAALKAGGIESAQEVTQLTPELLAGGRWRGVILKRYDVTLATAPRHPGKEHPLGRVIQEVRRAFFEMGFEEVSSPVVETAFWDFDALFQPQDHPAREMQDTFYLAKPQQGTLPDAGLVDRVRRTHEDGGDTGSTGWRYRWDVKKARRLVLRTHTTAATIRAVAQNPRPPRKVFSVGKVFRRENIDQTHLPEFIQIDGIIIDEQASFATLLGTLEAFYKKMGAAEVRFRPSFFPYTEPSAEVFARLGDLGWVEMCGSGVFRPEVTRPLGCAAPVLAWGGGVERIAMMRFGLDDIRKLYWADINWLKEARLSR